MTESILSREELISQALQLKERWQKEAAEIRNILDAAIASGTDIETLKTNESYQAAVANAQSWYDRMYVHAKRNKISLDEIGGLLS